MSTFKKITARERYLMNQAFGVSENYNDADTWLAEVISDSGHTVEDAISWEADQHQKEEDEKRGKQ